MINDSDQEYDVRNLYPVQIRPKVRFNLAALDERDEDSPGNDDNRSSPENNKKEKTDDKRIVMKPTALAVTQTKSLSVPAITVHRRRGSDTPPSDPRLSTTSGANGRRMSTFPTATMAGPNGRRQSTHIDYDFYDRRIANMPTLASRVEAKSTMLDEATAAVSQVKLSGLREFVRARDKTVKVFWLLLFIACMTVLSYEVKKAADNYRLSPITTTFTIRTPRTLNFPDIYICFGNGFNRTYIRQHPEAVKGIENIYETVVGGQKRRRRRQTGRSSIGDDFALPWDMEPEHYLESLLSSNMNHGRQENDHEEHERWRRDADNNSTADRWYNEGDVAYNFILSAGFRVKETFLKCSFQSYTLRTYDCSRLVKPVMDPNYFTCFVVSVPESETQTVASRGLRLLIDSHIRHYPLVKENDTAPAKYQGLFVSVSDRFDPTNWYKAVVPSGSLTKLSLSATSVKLLSIEKGPLKQPCVENGTELYRIFNTSYSRTACQMDCLVYAFYKACNCVFRMDKSFIRSDVLANASLCSFAVTKSCIIPNVTDSQAALDEVNRCRLRCHTPCTSTRYEIRGSTSRLNPGAFAGEGVPVNELIQLDVSFGRMEVDELTQSYSKTTAQMIADIGGNVNLWLGASMITMLEIPIRFIVYCCYRTYERVGELIYR